MHFCSRCLFCYHNVIHSRQFGSNMQIDDKNLRPFGVVYTSDAIAPSLSPAIKARRTRHFSTCSASRSAHAYKLHRVIQITSL